MEIQPKDLQIGQIYNGGGVIFRYNGRGENDNCAKTTIIGTDYKFQHSICCSFSACSFREGTPEEILWLEVCEQANKTVPKPKYNPIINPLIFN